MPRSSSTVLTVVSAALAVTLMALASVTGTQAREASVNYGELQHDWSGFYAGLHGGYNWGDVDGAARWVSVNGPLETFAYGIDGVTGGIHAGYSRQLNNVVIGFEADIAVSETDGRGPSTANMIHTTMVDWLATVRLRLGVTLNNTLVYLAGGPAMGHVETEQRMPRAVANYAEHSDWKLGWTIGAGIEQALSPKLSLRLDYRYVDLGEIPYRDPGLAMNEKTRLDSHSIRAGISFKF